MADVTCNGRPATVAAVEQEQLSAGDDLERELELGDGHVLYV